MTERERLIKLLYNPFIQHKISKLSDAGDIADHLLSNGVIVPPCKVGQTVWEIDTLNPFEDDLKVMESKVEDFSIMTNVGIHHISGKTVFLTREEAEQELRKVAKEKL